MILHPFFMWDTNPHCDDNCDPAGNGGEPQEVVINSDCDNPVFVTICQNDAGEFDPILLCDEATGLPVIAIVTYSETGIPTTALYNLDGSAFTGTPAKCSSDDLELSKNPFCIDGVDFVRVDVVDPENTTAPVSSSFWQDITGAVVGDPTIGATEVKAGTCSISCFTPVGVCKCYGDENASSASYQIDDNETDGTFSHNSDTLKWEVDTPAAAADGLAEFTLAVVDCINSGNVANLTITDQDGIATTFAASSILASGNPDGSGNWAFNGVSPGSFSGKITIANLSCGDEAGLSEACKYENCDTGEIIWKDVFTDAVLTTEQIETLTACIIPVSVEPVCEESVIQRILCAAEDITDPSAGAIVIGDQILIITRVDCENVIVSSKAYLLSNATEITDAILTDDCDPQPDVETIRTCIEDEEGNQWTQIAVVDPDTGISGPALYFDNNLNLGAPSGDPANFTNCAEFVDIRDVKLCEKNARFLLLVDGDGVFARYSFFTNSWEVVNTLSVPSFGGSADVSNFLLYNFVTPDQLTTVDVNTDTQLPNTTLIDGVIKPGETTNPKTFSSAGFRDTNGRLYAWDVSGTDSGLYSVDVNSGEVDFVTDVTGVSGSGVSLLIDNQTDTLYISGTNDIYEVDWVSGVATIWATPPIRANGATFDTSGNAYVTYLNDTYFLPAGADGTDPNNWIQIIDDFAPGANSLAYYEVIAPEPSCFFRRYGIQTNGERELIGDFNISDDSPRTIVGDVDCCECGCNESGIGTTESATIESREVCFDDGSTGFAIVSITEFATTLLRFEDSIGQVLTGVTIGECGCPCEDVLAKVCLRGFDYQDLGTWDAGDQDLQWEIFLDGVSQGITTDAVVTQDNGFKSSWYANLMAGVNATAWSMTVDSDVPSDNSGTDDKVTFSFEGPSGSELRLERQTGTDDILILTANADGTLSASFVNSGGDDIDSNLIVPCS